MSIMRAQLPRELHAYGDMVGNRAALETGAPSITYQGQEGPQAGGQPRPEELIIQLQEAYKQHRAQGGQLTFEEFVEVVMSQNQNRQQAAYGGIMGADGRRQYGIGSWFQEKVMDPIKGVVKSDLGKAALGIGAGAALNQWGIPGTGKGDPANNWGKNWFSNVLKGITGKGKNLDYEGDAYGTKSIKDYVKEGVIKPDENKKDSWIRDALGTGIGSALSNPNFLIPAAGLISGAFAKEDDPGYTGQGTGLNIRDIGKIANITDEKQGQAAGLRFLPQVSARKYTPEEMISTYATTEAEDFSTPEKAAQGGRIGYDMGGDVEIPEQFLEDLKRRDFHKLLEDYRRWQEHQNRDFGPGGQEVAQGGRIGYNSGGFSAEDLLVLKKHKYNPSEVAGWKDKGRGLLKTLKGFYTLKADGGRIGAQEGGLMSLGGNEMDLRGGGFVPIGEQEKADDVPARLSKNEFVFTADAVRAAGGGDVNKGADKMYKTMKELEGVVA